MKLYLMDKYDEIYEFNQYGVIQNKMYTLDKYKIIKNQFSILFVNESIGNLDYTGLKIVYVVDMVPLINGTISEFFIEDSILKYFFGENADIKIPDNVQRIGEYAFYCNKKIISVDLNNVLAIGMHAFEFSGIHSFTGGNLFYIDDRAFNRSELKTLKLDYPHLTFGEYVFKDCYNLHSIELSKFETLSKGMFYNCTDITELVIPDTVQYIEDYALGKCYHLKKLTIYGEPNISENAFLQWGLTQETIKEKLKESSKNGEMFFYYITSPTTLIMSKECFGHNYSSFCLSSYKGEEPIKVYDFDNNLLYCSDMKSYEENQENELIANESISPDLEKMYEFVKPFLLKKQCCMLPKTEPKTTEQKEFVKKIDEVLKGI